MLTLSHVADTFWNGHYPFIDYSTGGSLDGMIRAAEANVARVTDKTIVIPGHGPIGNKSQLIEFHDMLVTIREKVAALKKQGKSQDEVVAAKPTADYDAKWGRASLLMAISLADWSIKALGKRMRICTIYEEPNPSRNKRI